MNAEPKSSKIAVDLNGRGACRCLVLKASVTSAFFNIGL
jgi:hypothetical protein